ncbi:hypothetical protein [Fimbriimonas ginsengisoli]|uniref:CopG family transcriptional regulator n=1 Tax=Fimbriimonas ginsengisoli Gsoil 348 TaxID=661478 RepID=A0A068NP15_FIMGI|nr:hypothetical protein [Fimbriimonas ginsengisoli]AIE85107.1 hypothetical protein OP10G_1739 [Fimbriimonas ginsengisoli Gsoil 348]
MKSVTVQLPDRLFELAEQAIRDGYFASMDDLVRISVMNFVRRPMLDRLAEHQLEDLAAAEERLRNAS